jgi:hypothetical protein
MGVGEGLGSVLGRKRVTADLDRVKVRAEGRIVANHPRVWARAQTITDPAHVETARRLRRQFQHRDDPRRDDPEAGLARDLGDYDRAFGLGQEVI